MTGGKALVEELRTVAFGIAYRMLGTVSEAEDIAQEATLRLHTAIERGEEISSPRAYVATVATRLAIDELRSARRRREAYVGEWLPEPVVTDPSEDPAAHAEMADWLSLAFLVVLEALTPEQRAAFLLHDVFDYGYGEVAEIVGTSEGNARQLASRARRHVKDERPELAPADPEAEELARSFFAATQEGDMSKLESLLARDVELHGDGGGKAPALARMISGRDRVIRTLGAWNKAGARIGGFRLEPIELNGQPGAKNFDSEGRLLNVLVLDIAGGEITAVRSVVNPDKLGHLGEVANISEMLKRRGA